MNEFEDAHEPLYVSMHIPKTAGTTLRAVLRSIFGSRLQEAYEDHPEVPRMDNPACIHGHDLHDMFGDVISKHPNVKWITFVRGSSQHGRVSLFPSEEKSNAGELC